MELSLRVDRELCIGSGQCVHWAPGVFDQDERAIALVVDPRGEPEHKVLQAVLGCPMQAIAVRVGATEIGPGSLKDWMQGAHIDDPVVALLGDLTGTHEHVRAMFARAGDGRTRDGDLSRAIEQVLLDEAQLYEAIEAAGLVDHEIMIEFRSAHAAIEHARTGPASELTRLVDDHLRLEETVLFPVALSTVARRARARAATAGPAAR